MSAFCDAVLIQGGSALQVRRVPVAGRYDERWLQVKLFEHPATLPALEIDPHLQPLVPVCMELNTPAGPADILYVTRSGQIVLVEVKLWANYEARREVVAQILDYAKELTKWTYADLAREVAKTSGKGPGHLLESVRARHPDLDDKTFCDGVSHSLRTGDMLLLIAGDGIRSGTEALVGFMELYGSLRFSFGLVEVAAYEIGDGVLLQPRILAKTEVFKRNLVIAVGADGKELIQENIDESALAAAEAEESPELRQARAWNVCFWDQFLKVLRLDDSTQPYRRSPPLGTNFVLPMPPGGSENWVSVYVARSTNRIGAFLTWPKDYELAKDAYETLLADRVAIESEVGQPLEFTAKDGKFTVGHHRPAGNLDDPQQRSAALAYLASTTNALVNAFRPRLQAFVEARR